MVSEKKLFGLRVKHLRESKGWTQENLTERMNISSNYLSSIERGMENPTFDMLINLAKALQVDMWELFDFGHEVSSKELKAMMNQFTKKIDEEKLRLAVKVVKTIVR